MFRIVLTRLAQWRAYRKTYRKLQAMDRKLLADLGLADIDLDAISRAAAQHSGTVSLYDLVRAHYGEDIRKPVKFATRRAQTSPADATAPCAETCRQAA